MKEFKEWDKRINKALVDWYRENSRYFVYDGKYRDHFSFADVIQKNWSQDNVRWAVYEAPGVLDWQVFRVSMKGLTLQEKLHALVKRYIYHVSVNSDMDEECRIANYLGALVRAGMLTSDFRVPAETDKEQDYE